MRTCICCCKKKPLKAYKQRPSGGYRQKCRVCRGKSRTRRRDAKREAAARKAEEAVTELGIIACVFAEWTGPVDLLQPLRRCP